MTEILTGEQVQLMNTDKPGNADDAENKLIRKRIRDSADLKKHAL